MSSPFSLIILVLYLINNLYSSSISCNPIQPQPFAMGTKLILECKMPKLNPESNITENEFSSAFICQETKQSLHFEFGVESFLYCSIAIDTNLLMNYFNSLINQVSALQCRLPMSLEHSIYLPVLFPVWGVVEPTHSHINYHYNFLFHYDPVNFHLIGATIYPLRDRFTFIKSGMNLPLHGPVKWMKGHTYNSITGDSGGDTHSHGGAHSHNTSGVTNGEIAMIVMFWCLLTSTVIILGGIVLYLFKLKPAIIKKYLKAD